MRIKFKAGIFPVKNTASLSRQFYSVSITRPTTGLDGLQRGGTAGSGP